MNDWIACPFDTSEFHYEGAQLERHWARLHKGDGVVFPGVDVVAEWVGDSAALKAWRETVPEVASGLQDAWRAFHAGRFAEAVDMANRFGPLGANCACKATGIYAGGLEPDEATRRRLYRDAATLAEISVAKLPELASSHYFHAFALGRLGQSLSIAEALRAGMAGKISASLDRALDIDPELADAHIAYGMYHAEIVAKVGKLVARVSYGATAQASEQHFERALDLVPESPIAHIEFGNGLYLLFGDDRLDEVTDLYVRASELTPADAMEKIDIEQALAELE